VGEAKRRGSYEKRVEEGIEKDRIKLEEWQVKRAELLKNYKSDPVMTEAIRQTIIGASMSLFSAPKIKTKRWLK
jgi:hypothetical protein